MSETDLVGSNGYVTFPGDSQLESGERVGDDKRAIYQIDLQRTFS